MARHPETWFYMAFILILVSSFIAMSAHFVVESYKDVIKLETEASQAKQLECPPPIIYGNTKP